MSTKFTSKFGFWRNHIRKEGLFRCAYRTASVSYLQLVFSVLKKEKYKFWLSLQGNMVAANAAPTKISYKF